MEDLQKFTDFIFGDQQGYVYSPVKRPDEWDERFFQWPTQRDELHAWIITNSTEQGSNVYLSPAVYREKSATKLALKSAQVVWVEFDGQEQISFGDLPSPDCIVQSSTTTHMHCYWRVDSSGVDVLEEINRRLTYHLGADSSGWDATQILRPPETINYKHDLPVVLASFSPVGIHDFKEFDSAPTVKYHTSIIESVDLLDARKLLLTKPLPAGLTRRIKTETPEAPTDGKPGQRSQFLYKIASELAEQSCSREEIVSLLFLVDDRIEKFKGRSDQMLRLSQLADLAVHKIEVDNRLSLYTYNEVQNHTDHLEWIIPTWLHTTGQLIVTGPPSVGKTQFGIQLITSLCANTPFLNMTLESKITYRAVMFSLEMDIRELRYITQHQAKHEWGEWDKDLFLISDELGSFGQYEAIIKEVQPQVVLIDSLSELFEEDMNSSTEARHITRWLRSIRRAYHTSMVVIHHDRKTDGKRNSRGLSNLFGSFVLAKDTDTVVGLSDSGVTSIGLELDVYKCRFGPKQLLKLNRDENLIFTRREENSITTRPKEEGNALIDATTDTSGGPLTERKDLGMA